MNVTQIQVDTDVASKQAVYSKVDSKPVMDTLNRVVLRIDDESGYKTKFNIRSNQKLKK